MLAPVSLSFTNSISLAEAIIFPTNSFTPSTTGIAMTHLTVTGGTMPVIQPGPISINGKTAISIGTEASHPMVATGARAQLGSWFVGSYFDTPYSPNLTLTMTRDFRGIDSTTTVADKRFTKINYDSPAPWTQYHSADTLNENSSGAPLSYQIPSMEQTGVGPFKMDNGNDWDDSLPS